MCYYNGIKIPQQAFIRLKNFELAIAQRELFDQELVNGFDYGQYPVLRKSPVDGEIEIVAMEWGFLPHYLKTKDEVEKFRKGFKKPDGQWKPAIITLNARGDELLTTNKIYRKAALSRRCLVPSSGFYEWRHYQALSKKTGKPLKKAEKIPYFISLSGKEYFFMAGVWQPWKDVETGEYIETFAIVTTAANALMSIVHNSKKRMPLILNDDLAVEWLFTEDENRIGEIAGFQLPADAMKAHTIHKDFRNDEHPSAPFEYADLPG